MKRESIYTIVNIKTGEIVEGTAKEVAKVLGCTPCTVRKYGHIYGIYKSTWKIENVVKYANGEVLDDCNSLTEEDLQKWDDFINSIHREKRKKGRFRKPQEISR